MFDFFVRAIQWPTQNPRLLSYKHVPFMMVKYSSIYYWPACSEQVLTEINGRASQSHEQILDALEMSIIPFEMR